MPKDRPSALLSMSRLIKLLIGIPVLGIAAAIAFAGYLYFTYTRDLPDVSSIGEYSPPVISEVYDVNNVKIGEFWKQKRILTPFEQIPPMVVKAFIASEDARFYEHTGVDIRSIARAFLKNMQAGRVVQGGSTITQQVARALLLTRDRTFARKIKEAILATQIEQNLEKNDILYLYLNQIYLGNRSYGVAAAANNYFNKTLPELTLAETAMIAGLPSAPAEFAPTRRPKQAKLQQKKVLDRMVAAEFITSEQAEQAFGQELTVYSAPTDKEYNSRYVPYFTEYVRRLISDNYGSDILYKGGLKIYTTVDWKVQQSAQQAVRNGLRSVDKRQGFRGPIKELARDEWESFNAKIHKQILRRTKRSFQIPTPPSVGEEITPLESDELYQGVITATQKDRTLDVQVGNITGTIAPEDHKWVRDKIKSGWVVWVKLKPGHTPAPGIKTPFTLDQEPKVEGALFSLDPRNGHIKAIVGGYDYRRSEFNRATQAIRQPGSAFKPMIYAAALDKGYSPSTSIDDSPVTFQVGERSFWSPQNYARKFYGPMDLASALKHSVNVIAVKIFHDIGIDYALAFAHKLGLEGVKPYLSSALGASDTKLIDMVRAYTVFPGLGVLATPIAILKITDKQGKVLLEVPETAPPSHEVAVSLQEEDQLNPELISREEKYIKEQKLELSPEEMKTLYGARIPAGHTITPQTAFIMTRLMKNVVDAGTGFPARIPEWQIGGKTGTTNKETDAWFIGYTANLCTGVWVGYENKKRLGRGMTGGKVSAPIWKAYMKAALAGTDPISLPIPKGLSLAELANYTGGSALYHPKKDALIDGDDVAEGVMPEGASDFLFEDF